MLTTSIIAKRVVLGVCISSFAIKQNKTWVSKARELYKVQTLRKHYEKAEHILHGELKSLSNGSSSMGGGYKFDRLERKGSVDYGVIPELKSVDLEKYRKDSVEYWKLSKI